MLSQVNNIEKVLSRFNIKGYTLGDTLVAEGDMFHLCQCPKTEIKIKEMKKIPYASVLGSLIYAQV